MGYNSYQILQGYIQWFLSIAYSVKVGLLILIEKYTIYTNSYFSKFSYIYPCVSFKSMKNNLQLKIGLNDTSAFQSRWVKML